MYFDTCYIAKFYCNEPDSIPVRELVRERTGTIHSSAWALAEVHAVLHRRIREASLSRADARALAELFSTHIGIGLWTLIPVTEALLRRTGTRMIAAPDDLFLRTADAVHLAAAQENGEHEVWTSDRHMLAAAPWFGLTGRTV